MEKNKKSNSTNYNLIAIDTTRKNGFNEGLFLHYLGLKPPLSHFLRVVVSPAKPSLGNVFPRVFLNLRKSLSKIPWV